MSFNVSSMFPQFSESQLREMSLGANGSFDKEKVNAALEKQMEMEKNREKGFINDQINQIKNKIEENEKEIMFYENKITKMDDDVLIDRYSKILLDIQKGIFEAEKEISELEKQLAEI